MSELIQMDNTYLSRIRLRRQIMDSHAEATLATNPVAEPATFELYEWLVGTYLPRRFPTCYELVNVEKVSGDTVSVQQVQQRNEPTHLLNKITCEHIPLQATSPLTALRTLGSHIDTDFLILLPKQTEGDEENEPQTVYHLEAFSTTFPSGFSTLSKLGLPLSAIHTPVPQYARKIGKSMDRFFARLEVGKLVRRANWTTTTTPTKQPSRPVFLVDCTALSSRFPRRWHLFSSRHVGRLAPGTLLAWRIAVATSACACCLRIWRGLTGTCAQALVLLLRDLGLSSL
jgi:hypothetical protein